jgi:2-dehydro-3-deoxy-D-pentonate aldolase
MSREIKGIFTPNLVPLIHGAINEPELRRYVEWLVQKGVNGIFANGSTGEFARFSLEERKRITEIIVHQVHGRIPVMSGAAEANRDTVLAVCEHYKTIGCDAVSLCAPYYFKLSDEAVSAYFEEIARHSPMDILLYNIPQFANAISIPVVKHLCQFPRIIGIKDSSRNFPEFLTMMHEVKRVRSSFIFFTGTEEMLLPALFMGATGGTVALSGILPETVGALCTAFQNGEYERARDLQNRVLPLIRALFSADFPEGFRLGVELRGFHMGEGRQVLHDEQRRKLARLRLELEPILSDLLLTGA